MRLKKNEPFYQLVCEYAGLDHNFDRTLTKVARGSMSSTNFSDGGSGFSFLTQKRDITFNFRHKLDRNAARRRVKKAYGRKVSTFIYSDTKDW